MKISIPNNITRAFYKSGLTLKKHSPEILIAVGVVGAVTSAVMACKATTKAGAIIEDTNEQLETIQTVANNPKMADQYTEEDYKKDRIIVYTQTGLKFVKLYGPSVALGVASIGCILASHNILRKRNVAIAAAYTAVEKGFKEYRGRVIERFGKELDRELKYNIKAREVEEIITNDNGEEVVTKKVIDTVDPNAYSPHSIFFDDGNPGWDKNPELTKYFLIQQQNFANEKLERQGYLFLNDVYKLLGAKPTAAGQMVGWIYDEENPIGDNFVDFGIFDIDRPNARAFVNGYERVIILDFNVDGNILQYI